MLSGLIGNTFVHQCIWISIPYSNVGLNLVICRLDLPYDKAMCRINGFLLIIYVQNMCPSVLILR